MHSPLLPQRLYADPSDTELKRLLEKYTPKQHFAYGTAGFRYSAGVLDAVMVRVGVAAALLSVRRQAAIGVMITASHNDESYNGVKISEPDGGMMLPDGETLAVELVNENDPNVLWNLIQDQRRPGDCSAPCIHIGRDTREHSPALACLLTRAARALGCNIIDHGVVTTPMLHHAVRHAYTQAIPSLIPIRPNAMGYLDLLAYSYVNMMQTAGDFAALEPLTLDCACGVGFVHLNRLSAKIKAIGFPRDLNITNGPDMGPLNEQCGSEFVQKNQQPPVWYDTDRVGSMSYCAALDGDADRIVFFKADSEFQLLDGDRIACLFCKFIQQQLLVLRDAFSDLTFPSLGVVQTAYANGASTAYLRSVLTSPQHVRIAKTGVKHVHKEAHDHFDIGVYFEANGHGTVLFQTAFYDFVHTTESRLRTRPDPIAHKALLRLSILPSLINQAVGDALSDLLAVDAMLYLLQWSVDDWINVYSDLPSRQCKVSVTDRTVIETNDNETACLRPVHLQEDIDQACQTYGGRAFVRPSGTEDVVRVYAEAATREQADALASAAASAIFRHCGGVGSIPVFPNSRM